jgi:hypothetical protein
MQYNQRVETDLRSLPEHLRSVDPAALDIGRQGIPL